MDYVFGTKGAKEILKTKGDTHTSLTGFHQVKQEYPDQTITDNFRVVCKINSREDDEGSCYDWYEIDRHFRTVDKASQLAELSAAGDAALEDALCEQDEITSVRLTAIEDAICELDAAING